MTAPSPAARTSVPSALPPTSLAVCSRNRPDLLLQTVETVLEGNELPDELMIIDQSDEPHPVLSQYEPSNGCCLQYIWTEVIGVSAARNRAIRGAESDIVVLIDDDMLVPRAWFGALVRALLSAGPNSVVTGSVLSTHVDEQSGFAPSTRTDTNRVIYEGPLHRDVLYSGNMALWREDAIKVGLFDERLGPGTSFPAAEDNDFAFRLLRAGFRIVYEPNAAVYHRAWRRRNEAISLYRNYGYGQGAFYAKHVRGYPPMLRRLARDIVFGIAPFPLRLWSKGSDAIADFVFGVAIIIGFTRWLARYRWA